MRNYQQARGKRYFSNTKGGRFRAGKLAPIMAEKVDYSEGGVLSQSVTFELDPIAGRVVTPIYAEVIALFVPTQAIDAIKNPGADFPGLTEVIREKLLTGNPLFVLENEGEITRRCGIEPISIGGVLKVSEEVRLAHNAAVNFLRLRKYHKATTILGSSTAITPALIGQSVLDRFNAVLDPDDHINGVVPLQLPTMNLPVTGIGVDVANNYGGIDKAVREATGQMATYPRSTLANNNAANQAVYIRGRQEGGVFWPDIKAIFGGGTVGNIGIDDFYNAQAMDRLVREMGQIIEADPVYGEEKVVRWAHGLSVDDAKTPFVLFQKTQEFGKSIVPAMDSAGVAADTMRSDMALEMVFTVPVPKTELGGVIVTFACLKPDEVIARQPHPYFSEPFGIRNKVSDELALDPVPVTMRQINSACGAGNESTVAFYTGLNELKRNYVQYGFNRHLDPNTVANKTSIWQLEIPLSVTPATILYPETLSQYPFADQLAEVCTYVVASRLVVESPLIVGPTPIETLPIIGSADLFDEV